MGIFNKSMNSQNKIKIGILGGSGYAGEELVRLISLHPNADLSCCKFKRFVRKESSECL